MRKQILTSKSTKILAGILAISTVGFSQAVDTFNFSATTIQAVDPFGDPSNFVYTGPNASSSYRLGQSVNLTSLTLNKIAENTYASEFQIGLRNSGFPGIDARFAPSTTDGYTGTLVVIPASRPLTGALVGSNIVAGTAWSIEAADTLNDTLNTSEQTATNLVFSTTVYIAPPQTFLFSGTSVDFIGDPDNTIVNLGTYTGTSYRLGPLVNLNGGTLATIGTSWPSDTVCILRNSANPLGRIAVRLSESIDGGATVPISGAIDLSLPLTGITEPSYSYNLLLATIPTGSSWTAEFVETFDDTDNVPEATITNLSISLNATAQTLPVAATPATFTDLGSISAANASLASPLVINQSALGLNQVRWFKFTTPGFNQGGRFLDIYGRTDTATTFSEDTEFALFDNSGLLIAADDDNSIGALSQLSFGDSNSERPAVPGTVNDLEGSPMYGLNGDGLPAGTYWLAVAPWSSISNNFNNGFVVNTESGSIGAYPWKLVFQTNVVAQATISGTLTLADTVDDGIPGTESIGYTLSNGTNTYTGNVSVSDFSGGAYSITVPAGAPNGAYTLRFKGGTFLANTLNITLTGASLSGQNTTLENGDVDQDGEVGPGDFEEVVAQFGGTGSADVDNDGEVGPGDFEIIVANFGSGDQ